MNTTAITLTVLLLLTGCAFLVEPMQTNDRFYQCQKTGCLT